MAFQVDPYLGAARPRLHGVVESRQEHVVDLGVIDGRHLPQQRLCLLAAQRKFQRFDRLGPVRGAALRMIYRQRRERLGVEPMPVGEVEGLGAGVGGQPVRPFSE